MNKKTQERNTENAGLKSMLDETIGNVCMSINENCQNSCFEEYADVIKALASLVEARAKLDRA